MLLDCDEAARKTGLITIQVCFHKLTSGLTHTGKGAIDDINSFLVANISKYTGSDLKKPLWKGIVPFGTSLSPLCRVTTYKTVPPYIFWEERS